MLPPRLAVRLAWASALSILIAYTAAASIGRTTHGFIAYYGGARLFIDGELSADAYDDRWFNEYVQRITNSGIREMRLTAFRFLDGWSSLVAYPRLYAAWLLWNVHVFEVRKWFRRFPESSTV